MKFANQASTFFRTRMSAGMRALLVVALLIFIPVVILVALIAVVLFVIVGLIRAVLGGLFRPRQVGAARATGSYEVVDVQGSAAGADDVGRENVRVRRLESPRVSVHE